MRKIIAFWMIAATLLISAPASALIGDEIFCNPHPGSIVSVSPDSNDLIAQNFTTGSGFQLGAVKLNLYSPGGPNTVLAIRISATTGATPAPDLNTVLATETVNTNDLPLYDAVIGSNNAMSCSPLSRPTQVVVFDPAPNLAASTTYAVSVEWGGGSTSTMVEWPYILFDDSFNPGSFDRAWECLVPVSCTKLTPATWDTTGGDVDYGFVVFDNFLESIEAPPGTLDFMLTTLLNILGMNDTSGRILFSGIFGVMLIIVLAFLKIPFFMAIVIGGILAAGVALPGFLVLIPAWLFLSVVIMFAAAWFVAQLLGRDRGGAM